jgi:hypothetical protein
MNYKNEQNFESQEPRQWMNIRITPELLVEWCVQGTKIHAECVKGLPADAQYMYAWSDYTRRDIVIVVQSKTFPKTPYGKIIPDFPLLEFKDITNETNSISE